MRPLAQKTSSIWGIKFIGMALRADAVRRYGLRRYAKGHECEIFWQYNWWQNNQVTMCCMTRLMGYLFFSSASIRAICG